MPLSFLNKNFVIIFVRLDILCVSNKFYIVLFYMKDSLSALYFLQTNVRLLWSLNVKKTTDSFSKKNKLKRNIFITTAWHHYSKFQKININNITTTFLLGYVVMRNFLLKHKMFNKNKIALFVNFILEPFLCFINKKTSRIFFFGKRMQKKMRN